MAATQNPEETVPEAILSGMEWNARGELCACGCRKLEHNNVHITGCRVQAVQRCGVLLIAGALKSKSDSVTHSRLGWLTAVKKRVIVIRIAAHATDQGHP